MKIKVIDTIRIHLPWNYKVSETFKQKLVRYTHFTDGKDFRIIREGLHNNFTLKRDRFGTYIMGSICKYHHGNNFQTLTRTNFIEAIDKLSHELNLDLTKGNVTRLDIADNMETKHHPSYYNDCIVSYPRFIKRSDDDSITFSGTSKTKTKVLKFYSKCDEAIAKGISIPEPYQNRNLFRFEVSISRHVTTRLQLPHSKLFLFFNEEVYESLIEYWNQEFQKLKLAENKIVGNINWSGCKLSERYLLTTIQAAGSEAAALLQHKKDYIAHTINYSQYRTAIKKIRTLSSQFINDNVDESLRQELIGAVGRAVACNKALL